MAVSQEFVQQIIVEDLGSAAMAKMKNAAKSLTEGFGKVKANIVVLNQAFELFGRIQAQVGRAMAATVGRAIELEKNVAEITTLLDDASNAQAYFTEEILKMQQRFGTEQTDLAKAYYQALSSGAVDSTNATDLLTAAQKLAVGGVTTLTTSVDGLTTILNAYGLNADRATDVSDALFLGMKAGKTTIGELSSTLGQAASLANATGVSFQELVAAVSAVTTGGVDTSVAVTQVRSVMVGLNKQTADLTNTLQKLGITSIQEAINQKGLVNVLREIIASTDGTTESLTTLFGRIEAVNAILALTSDEIGGKFNNIMTDMGKAAEQTGKTTEDAFNKIAKTTAFRLKQIEGQTIARLTRIGNLLKDIFVPIMETLLNAIKTVENGFDSLAKAINRVDFKAMADQAQILEIALLSLASAIGIAFRAQIANLIIAFGAALKGLALSAAAAAAPTVLLAGKIALITAGILAAVAAIDIFMRNIDNLGKLFETVGESINNFFIRLQRGVVGWFGVLFGYITNATQALNKLGLVSNDTMNNMVSTLGKTADAIDGFNGQIENSSNRLALMGKELDFGFAGEVFKQAKNFLSGFNDELGTTQDMANKASKAIKEIAPPGAGQQIFTLNEDDKKVLDEIVQRTEKMNDELAKAGLNELQIIEYQKQKDMEFITAFEEKLRSQRKLNGETQSQIDSFKEVVDAQSEAAALAAKSEAGKRLAGPIGQVGGELSSTFKDLGILMGESMGGVMTSISDSIMSAVSSASMAIIGALLKAPDIMNSIAGLLTEITNWPTKLFEAFKGLNDAIISLITDFIPNLAQGIGDILMEAVTMLADKLPDAIVGLAEAIPNVLMKLVERLPEIAVKFAEALVKMDPTILATKFMLALIKGVPKLMSSIAKAIPEIVTGFVDSFILAMKESINELTKGFGLGEIFNIDTSKAEEQLKSLGENLSRSTSKVFQVVDLEAAARGLDVADRIRTAIESGTTRAKNVFSQIWAALEKVWIWVRDKILMPIWDLITKAWQWVWDKVLSPVIDALRTVWLWVWDNIISPTIDALKAVWTLIIEKIIKPVFDWIKTTFENIVGLFKTVFSFVKDTFDNIINLFSGLWDAVKKIFEGVMMLFQGKIDGFKVMFEGVMDAFKAVIDFFKKGFDNIVSLLRGVGEFYQKAFDSIVALLRKVGEFYQETFDKVIEMFSKIFDSLKGIFEIAIKPLKDLFDSLKNIFSMAIQPLVDLFGSLDLSLSVPDWLNGISLNIPVFDFSVPTPDWLNRLKIEKPSWLGDMGGIVAGKSSKLGNKISDAWKRSDAGKAVSSASKAVSSVVSSVKGRLKYEQGGIVPNGSYRNGILYAQGGALAQGTDTVPAVLTPGEFIVNRQSARNNLGLLSFINKSSGTVTPVQNPTNISIVINTKTDLSPEQIRREVIPTLEKELRKKSVNGRWVISESGIRS